MTIRRPRSAPAINESGRRKSRLANADSNTPEATQLLVITHERQFFQLLVNIEKLRGQQGLVVRLNAASKVATVVNGASLARSYEEAKNKGDDALGHRYVFEIRTYCEDLLKIMLRAEGPDVCDLSLDGLANLMKKLREASVAPFQPAFIREASQHDRGRRRREADENHQ